MVHGINKTAICETTYTYPPTRFTQDPDAMMVKGDSGGVWPSWKEREKMRALAGAGAGAGSQLGEEGGGEGEAWQASEAGSLGGSVSQ